MHIPGGVYAMVSGEEPSGWLPNEAELIQQNQREFDVALREVITDALQLMDEKAEEYDFGETWWGHQPFGDLSFASAIAEIVRRLESVLRGSHPNKTDIVEDKSVDLLVYTLAWLAWRKIKIRQLAARSRSGGAEFYSGDDVSYGTSEAAQKLDREIMSEPEPYTGQLDQPDTSGPVPKEGLVKRLRKLGRKE